MIFTIAEIFLFGFGLIPQYVSLFVVERHYTNYWTGFWNVFGLIQVLVAMILSSNNANMVVDGSVILFAFMLILYLALLGGRENLVRRIGASLITTSMSWGLFVWFYTGSLGTGYIVGVVHGFGLLGLVIVSGH